MPEHLAFLLRPIALNVPLSTFSVISGNRVPQDLNVVLRGRSFTIRAIVDTGCMRTIITAPPEFFANIDTANWRQTPILGIDYYVNDMNVALTLNGTTLPVIRAEITNHTIQGNDGNQWQGIIGMDVIQKCSVYLDIGHFLMLGYEATELAKRAVR